MVDEPLGQKGNRPLEKLGVKGAPIGPTDDVNKAVDRIVDPNGLIDRIVVSQQNGRDTSEKDIYKSSPAITVKTKAGKTVTINDSQIETLVRATIAKSSLSKYDAEAKETNNADIDGVKKDVEAVIRSVMSSDNPAAEMQKQTQRAILEMKALKKLGQKPISGSELSDERIKNLNANLPADETSKKTTKAIEEVAPIFTGLPQSLKDEMGLDLAAKAMVIAAENKNNPALKKIANLAKDIKPEAIKEAVAEFQKAVESELALPKAKAPAQDKGKDEGVGGFKKKKAALVVDPKDFAVKLDFKDLGETLVAKGNSSSVATNPEKAMQKLASKNDPQVG